MKIIARLILAVLGLIIVFVVLYLLGIAVLRTWVYIVVVGYLLGVLLAIAINGIGAFIMILKPDAVLGSQFALLEKVNRRREPLHFCWRLGTLVLEVLSSGLLWPWTVLASIAAAAQVRGLMSRLPPSIMRTSAIGRLRGNELLWWLVALLSVVLVALVHATEVHGSSRLIVIVLVVVGAMVARLALYAASPTGLAGILRSSLTTPILHAIGIGIAAVAATSMSLAVLQSQSAESPFRLEEVSDALVSMFSFRATFMSMFGAAPSLLGALAALLGLLVSTTVVRNLFQFRNFRRTDPDVIQIARMLQSLGQFVQAGQWLRRVKQENADSLGAKAVNALGLNQIDDATGLISRAVDLTVPARRPGLDLLVLIKIAARYPIPKHVYRMLFRMLVEAYARDRDVYDAVPPAIESGGITPGEILHIIEQHAPTICRADGYSTNYALTRLGLAMLNMAEDQIRAEIGRWCPVDKVERATFSCFAMPLFAVHADDLEQSREVVEEWFGSTLQAIVRFARSLPDREDRVLIGLALRQAMPAVVTFAPDRIQELEHISDGLIGPLSDLGQQESSLVGVLIETERRMRQSLFEQVRRLPQQ